MQKVVVVAVVAHRGQQPAVRPIVVACRGGSDGTQQGAMWVAHDGARDELSLLMGHITPVMPV